MCKFSQISSCNNRNDFFDLPSRLRPQQSRPHRCRIGAKFRLDDGCRIKGGPKRKFVSPLDDGVKHEMFGPDDLSADNNTLYIQQIYDIGDSASNVTAGPLEHHLRKIVIVFGSRNNIRQSYRFLGQLVQ